MFFIPLAIKIYCYFLQELKFFDDGIYNFLYSQKLIFNLFNFYSQNSLKYFLLHFYLNLKYLIIIKGEKYQNQNFFFLSAIANLYFLVNQNLNKFRRSALHFIINRLNLSLKTLFTNSSSNGRIFLHTLRFYSNQIFISYYF